MLASGTLLFDCNCKLPAASNLSHQKGEGSQHMKRIINGTTYNTATSTQIGRWEQEADDWTPTDKVEILYKTRGGAFFVHTHEEWERDGEPRHRDNFEPSTREEAHK